MYPVQFTTTALQPVENLNNPGKKILAIAYVTKQDQFMVFNLFLSIDSLWPIIFNNIIRNANERIKYKNFLKQQPTLRREMEWVELSKCQLWFLCYL